MKSEPQLVTQVILVAKKAGGKTTTKTWTKWQGIKLKGRISGSRWNTQSYNLIYARFNWRNFGELWILSRGTLIYAPERAESRCASVLSYTNTPHHPNNIYAFAFFNVWDNKMQSLCCTHNNQDMKSLALSSLRPRNWDCMMQRRFFS